ncbi:MAG: putative DNA binding domain-containing protein [Endomicrobium sp.]|jgi:ATP-dependent DNA helicase RecG|nr:putative DNA binding domain-containing protein [Endomicrobium sp.]
MSSCKKLDEILENCESSKLELKEAKTSFPYPELKKYCSALANEGGGFFILGVSDDRVPVGTTAYPNHNETTHKLCADLGIRVVIEEFKENKRVLVFNIPCREKGKTVKVDGLAYMRNGSSLVRMDDVTQAKIFRETQPDFSGEICKDFSLNDIDESAISNFKKLWSEKIGKDEYAHFANDKTLKAIGLMNDKGISNAAVILFGKKEKVDEFFPGSEIILEWRNNSSTTNYDFRQVWREPFFKIMENVWNTINIRNSKVSIQEGLFQKDIYIFSEKPIREALLNAVTHRDYKKASASIFIKFSPESFEIESPGGFLSGITPENVLNKQEWRNRCIAEAFEKAGLIERSGQGVDDIFSYTIKEGKGIPDFSKSDNYAVVLKIPAQIKDKEFIGFLNKIAKESNIILGFDDIYELENIRENKIPNNIKTTKHLIDLGVIEKIPYRKNQYVLCKKYYNVIGRKGEYTRIKGLERNRCKALLFQHIEDYGKGYLKEFVDVLPNLSKSTISDMLKELAKEQKIEFVGTRRCGYWVKSIK